MNNFHPRNREQNSTRLIAQGRTAEIFLLDDRHILKLYRDWCPPDWVDYEARVAHAIHAAGIPSPAAGEIIEVNGRRGLIYERLEGVSMLQDMSAHPWKLLGHARSLAELQVQINGRSLAGLPSYKDRLEHDIGNSGHLSEKLKEKVLAILDRLPDGKSLCHGDYHPGNVLITKDGPVVIDWMTASAGSRWIDVARTSLLLKIGPKGAGKQVQPILRLMIGIFHRSFLNSYHRLVPDTGNERRNWEPVIAAARLNEDIPPERAALIEMVKGSLKR